LVPNNFWLFQKLKSNFTGRIFLDTDDVQKKYNDRSEGHSAAVPGMFPTGLTA
jgi:hypothetical protein